MDDNPIAVNKCYYYYHHHHHHHYHHQKERNAEKLMLKFTQRMYERAF